MKFPIKQHRHFKTVYKDKITIFLLFLLLVKSNWLIKFIAVLLSVWYLIAVTGFDVHRCSYNGRTYIEPLAAGISCNDIHPDTPCCHHDGPEEMSCNNCQEDEECCTDEIEVIILPGFETGKISVPPVSIASVIQAFANESLVPQPSFSLPVTIPDRFCGPPDNILNLDCIMRA